MFFLSRILFLALSCLILNTNLYSEELLKPSAVNNLLSILKDPEQTKELIIMLENLNHSDIKDTQILQDTEKKTLVPSTMPKQNNFLLDNLYSIINDYYVNFKNNINSLWINIIPISYIFLILIGMMIFSEIIYNILQKNYSKKIKILNIASSNQPKYSIKSIFAIVLTYILYSVVAISISCIVVFIITSITSNFLLVETDIWFPIVLFAIVFPIFKIVMHVTNIHLGDKTNQEYHHKAITLSRMYYGLCYLFYALLVAILGITGYDLLYFIKTIIVIVWLVVNFYIYKNIYYSYSEVPRRKVEGNEESQTYGFLYQIFYKITLLVITITGIVYIIQSEVDSNIFIPNKLLYCMLCLILTISIYNVVTRIIFVYIEQKNTFLANIFANESLYDNLQNRLSLNNYVLVIASILLLLLFVCIGLNLDYILHIFLLDNVINAINTSIGRYIFNFIIPLLIVLVLLILVRELLKSLLLKIYTDKDKLNKYLSIMILLYKPYMILVVVVYFTLVSYFFGASFSALLASTGMLTLVVTLGFKDMIASFVRVIMNILSGGFRVNDNVIIAGQEGIVEDISIVYVKIRWGNGNLSLIPTSSIGLIVTKNNSVSSTRLDFVVNNTANYDDVVEDIKVITNSMYTDKQASSVLYKGNISILGITNYTPDTMTVSADLYYKTGKELEAKALYYEHFKILTQNKNKLKVIQN